MKRLFFILIFLAGFTAQAQFPQPFYGGIKTDSIWALNDTVHVNDPFVYPDKIQQLETIADLENYTGESTTIFVKDSLRGGIFNYEASGLTADNGVVFNAANGGFWKREFNKSLGLSAEWFGADPTYSVPSHDQINHAIQTAQNLGVKIVNLKPNGHYKVLKQINVIPGISLIGQNTKIDARGAVATLLSNTTPTSDFPNSALISVDGDLELVGKLSTDAIKGDSSLTLTSIPAVDIEQNDVLIVQDTASFSYHSAAWYFKEGQFTTVRSLVNDSNIIDITIPIIPDTIPESTGFVYRISNDPFTIKGLVLISNYNQNITSQIKSGLKVFWASNYTIDGITSSNFPVDNLNISTSFNAEIKNCIINKPEENVSQYNRNYGINIGGSQALNIHDNIAHSEFHAFTMGNSAYWDWDGAEYVENPVRPVNRYNIIHNNIFSVKTERNNASTYDNHPNCESNIVENNTIYGDITIQGSHESFINNTIYPTEGTKTIHLIEFNLAKTPSIKIVGNTVFGKKNVFDFFEFIMDNPESESYGNIIIRENIVHAKDSRTTNFIELTNDGVLENNVNIYLEENIIKIHTPNSNASINPRTLNSGASFNTISITGNSFDNILSSINYASTIIFKNNHIKNTRFLGVDFRYFGTAVVENNLFENTNVINSAGEALNSFMYFLIGNNVYVNGNISKEGNFTTYRMYFNRTDNIYKGVNRMPLEDVYLLSNNKYYDELNEIVSNVVETDPIFSASPAAGLLLHEQTITSAELTNSGTTPVELIADPGAGKIVVIEKIVGFMEAGTTAYDSDAMVIGYSGGVNITSPSNPFQNATADYYEDFIIQTPLKLIPNEGVQLSWPSITAGDGTVHLKIYYRIEEF